VKIDSEPTKREFGKWNSKIKGNFPVREFCIPFCKEMLIERER